MIENAALIYLCWAVCCVSVWDNSLLNGSEDNRSSHLVWFLSLSALWIWDGLALASPHLAVSSFPSFSHKLRVILTITTMLTLSASPSVIIRNCTVLLVRKFPTQPLLLEATFLFGWRLMKFKSLTSCSSCDGGMVEEQSGWERVAGRTDSECDGCLSLWVSSPLITKVGLWRRSHCGCFSHQSKDLTHVVWIKLYSVYKACGESFSRLTWWRVMPSGSVRGMCPMPCVRGKAGVFRYPAVLRPRTRCHSLQQLLLLWGGRQLWFIL